MIYQSRGHISLQGLLFLVVRCFCVVPGFSVSALAAFSSSSPTITLAESNSDGSATGQLTLDAKVTVSTSLANIPDNTRVWQLKGPGTITPGGSTKGWAVYSPPHALPSDRSVTITVWVNTNPSTTASYSFLLVDPSPVISQITPAKLLSTEMSGTQQVQINGSGFIPASIISLNGTTLRSTYQNNGQMLAMVPVQSNATGNLSLVARNAGAGGGTSAAYTLPLVNPVPLVSSVVPAELLAGGTQAVALTGSGFVPGTTVLFNGGLLPVAYSSASKVTVQVPVAANASGGLTLQVQNPGPGGGAGTSFAATVPASTITLTATDADGANTGTVPLGIPVAMSAAVTGSMQTAVNWSVSSGSISSSGVYLAQTMPAQQRVTITASLASNPAVTASYAAQVINPVPTITAASPAVIPAGATTLVTLTGSGFVPSTILQANGVALPTTYLSSTSVQLEAAVGASTAGGLAVQAYTAEFTGGLSNSFALAVSGQVSLTAAARLLDQTTFGPTASLIQHVQSEGATAWLTEQYNTPQTVLPVIPAKYPGYCATAEYCLESEWWKTVLTGNDQLRQRVAFALSELFVVSSNDVSGQGMQYYANVLAHDAFTNWYTILHDVTLSPAMGMYLNMVNSAKPSGTLIANENFARENMQLFNLGLNLLNPDGTLQRDAGGNPIPSYTEDQVQAFARVFTGWTFANSDGSTPPGLTGTYNPYSPMVAVESAHDQTTKTLLNGTVLPAGQSAEQDLALALTNVFEHPNTPPFVSTQLIQHLVKSNPSPDYVSRVAAVFLNNGNDVRGDMQAVLTAIFTDPEARAGDTAMQASDGHLREPILWLTAVMRGLGYVNDDPQRLLSLPLELLGHARRDTLPVPVGLQLLPARLRDSEHHPECAGVRTGEHGQRLGQADPGQQPGGQQHHRLQCRSQRHQSAWTDRHVAGGSRPGQRAE